MFTDGLRGIEEQDAGMRPLLDTVEMLDSEVDGQSKSRHEPRVTIPSRETEIYKATLVSLLNQDPQLSHERSVISIFFKFTNKLIHSRIHSTIIHSFVLASPLFVRPSRPST